MQKTRLSRGPGKETSGNRDCRRLDGPNFRREYQGTGRPACCTSHSAHLMKALHPPGTTTPVVPLLGVVREGGNGVWRKRYSYNDWRGLRGSVESKGGWDRGRCDDCVSKAPARWSGSKRAISGQHAASSRTRKQCRWGNGVPRQACRRRQGQQVSSVRPAYGPDSLGDSDAPGTQDLSCRPPEST